MHSPLAGCRSARLRTSAKSCGGREWQPCETMAPVKGEAVVSSVDAAREAFDAGDFEQARDLYRDAIAEERTAEALDGLGQSLWFLCEIEAGIARREEAYVAFRRDGQAGRAASIALWLSLEQATSLGNLAAANGWFRRAERLLADAPLCPAHAELEVAAGAVAADPEAARRHFERAIEIGKELDDPDSEVRGLNQLGVLNVRLGKVEAGTALLDETMTAAMAGELRDPWAVGATCCSVLFACEEMSDLRRAVEWSRAVIDFAERRSYVPLSALCRALHAGVLISIGDWQRGEAQLLVALEVYRGSNRPLAAYPLSRLADLRVRQGRLEEAERLLAGWESHPEAQLPMITLLVARGSNELAAERLGVALEVAAPGPAQAALLALSVRCELQCDRLDSAEAAARELQTVAGALCHEHLLATAALASGRVAAAAGDDERARIALEEAVERYVALQMPFELGSVRLELARLVGEANAELGIIEARRALEAFERLGASACADQAAELLRRLGSRGRRAPRASGELTRREMEVLGLLGEGLSNKEIAARLFITPKTASHHVGHILAKLDLRNRSEAAAYAVAQGLEPDGK